MEPGLREITKNAHGVSEKKTILVVEDEVNLKLLLEKLLIREGYKVVLAKDGFEAVNTYKKYIDDIDLILMDINMPVMGGIDAYKELSKFEKKISILFMSGTAPDSLQQFEHVNFIRKPMQAPTLYKTIKDIFESSTSIPNPGYA